MRIPLLKHVYIIVQQTAGKPSAFHNCSLLYILQSTIYIVALKISCIRFRLIVLPAIDHYLVTNPYTHTVIDLGSKAIDACIKIDYTLPTGRKVIAEWEHPLVHHCHNIHPSISQLMVQRHRLARPNVSNLI